MKYGNILTLYKYTAPLTHICRALLNTGGTKSEKTNIQLSRKGKFTDTEADQRLPRMEWEWGITENGHKGTFRGDRSVLKVDCGDGYATLYTFTKITKTVLQYSGLSLWYINTPQEKVVRAV